MKQVSFFSATLAFFTISLLFIAGCSDNPTGPDPVPTPDTNNRGSSSLTTADSGYALGSGEEFSCLVVEEVRIRFSDPGYIKSSEVGMFVKYVGMPPGEKKLRVWWDFENEPNRYRDTPIDESDRNPGDPGRYDFEGLLEHTYRNPEVKGRKIRVELILIGSTGNCARNRNIVLAPPDSAVESTKPPSGPCDGGPCTAFVSSSTHRGDSIGGLNGADTICQGLASAAGLSGTFKAWLSDSTGSPSTRFTQASTPYVRIDGAQIADSWADLTDGTLDNPLNLDENGVGVRTQTWTGTETDGTALTNHCNNWVGTPFGTIGDPTRTAVPWTNSRVLGCAFSLKIYCFQQ